MKINPPTTLYPYHTLQTASMAFRAGEALPPEVIEHILSEILDPRVDYNFKARPEDYHYPHDLKSMSLTCRYWAQRCRPHIFRQARVSGLPAVEGLLALIRSPLATISPPIAECIQTLSFLCIGASASPWFHRIGGALRPLLPSLERCDIRFEDIDNVARMLPSQVPRTLPKVFLPFRTLKLDFSVRFSTPADFVRLLASIPSLEEVLCQGCLGFDQHAEPQVAFQPSPQSALKFLWIYQAVGITSDVLFQMVCACLRPAARRLLHLPLHIWDTMVLAVPIPETWFRGIMMHVETSPDVSARNYRLCSCPFCLTVGSSDYGIIEISDAMDRHHKSNFVFHCRKPSSRTWTVPNVWPARITAQIAISSGRPNSTRCQLMWSTLDMALLAWGTPPQIEIATSNEYYYAEIMDLFVRDEFFPAARSRGTLEVLYWFWNSSRRQTVPAGDVVNVPIIHHVDGEPVELTWARRAMYALTEHYHGREAVPGYLRRVLKRTRGESKRKEEAAQSSVAEAEQSLDGTITGSAPGDELAGNVANGRMEGNGGEEHASEVGGSGSPAHRHSESGSMSTEGHDDDSSGTATN